MKTIPDRVDYTITIDWRYDFELMRAVQRRLDHLIEQVRYMKSRHLSIRTELAIMKELISIKRQIKAHEKLTWKSTLKQ